MGMRTIPTRKQIATAMKAYRYAAGADAAEAARAINKKAETLYKYESGKLSMSIEDMLTLLMLYGVELDDAFEGALPAQIGRRKDARALRLKKIERLASALPDKGQEELYRAAQFIAAYYEKEAYGHQDGQARRPS